VLSEEKKGQERQHSRGNVEETNIFVCIPVTTQCVRVHHLYQYGLQKLVQGHNCARKATQSVLEHLNSKQATGSVGHCALSGLKNEAAKKNQE